MDSDVQQWLWILKQTMSNNTPAEAPTNSVFVLSSLQDDNHSCRLSSVRSDPYLSFYAGTPIVSREGAAIGAVFLVDNAARRNFTTQDAEVLTSTARRCMDQLETARQCAIQGRWRAMTEQLNHLVGTRAFRDEELEEPPNLGESDQQRRRKDQIEELRTMAIQSGREISKAESVALVENDDASAGPETARLLRAKGETVQRIIEEDKRLESRDFTAQAEADDERSHRVGETTYQKIFRRAAQCMQNALHADGVLFADGLTGHHGIIQPVGEGEEELTEEIVRRPLRGLPSQDGVEHGSDGNCVKPDVPNHAERSDAQPGSSRTYTSGEYKRGIYVQRPAEIIGMSTRDPRFAPETKVMGGTTFGLSDICEGQIPGIMDAYPDGKVWYIDDDSSCLFALDNEKLVNENSSETHRFISAFPDVRQLIFQPLTHPVSLKRLGRCFMWSARTSFLFSDTTELASTRGLLHVLKAEVSRINAAAAVKQKEAFVSSISHELSMFQ
jgi:GAF domain-containing protein